MVHWDLHFNNFLISGQKIFGILDFERKKTEVASIDYSLSFVRRMQNNPKKFVALEMENNVEPKDYSKLMQWYREFYPEMFAFENLNRRLDVYTVEEILNDVYYFSDDGRLTKELEFLIS